MNRSRTKSLLTIGAIIIAVCFESTTYANTALMGKLSNKSGTTLTDITVTIVPVEVPHSTRGRGSSKARLIRKNGKYGGGIMYYNYQEPTLAPGADYDFNLRLPRWQHGHVLQITAVAKNKKGENHIVSYRNPVDPTTEAGENTYIHTTPPLKQFTVAPNLSSIIGSKGS